MSVKIEKIGVGIDGSEPSFRAVTKACELAASFGAEVIGIHVLPVPTELVDLGISLVEIERQLEIEAEAMLARGAEEAQKFNVPFTGQILRGNIPDIMANFAQEKGIDLLVVGFQGRSKLASMIMGSVTNRLLSRSRVPLFIVK